MNKFSIQNDFLSYLAKQPIEEKLNLKEEALQNLSKAALILDELKMYKTAESVTKMMEKTASGNR